MYIFDFFYHFSPQNLPKNRSVSVKVAKQNKPSPILSTHAFLSIFPIQICICPARDNNAEGHWTKPLSVQCLLFSNYLFTIWNYFNQIYSELIRIENWERFSKIKFSKMKLAAWILIGAQDRFHFKSRDLQVIFES